MISTESLGAFRRMPALILGALLATWLIWGSTYLVIRFALAGFPPFFMMTTRFFCAGGLLFAWQLARGAKWPTRVQWRNALLVGTLMLGGGMGGTAFAEQTIASGLVVLFIAVIPLLLIVINLAFAIHPPRRELTAVCVGVAGILMLTQGASLRASPKGLIAMSLACSGWSLGSVLRRRGFELAPGAIGFATEMLCGGLALMLMSALAHESWQLPAQPGVWLAWSYLVVFGSLIAFSAYMLLLARTSMSVAASYTLVNPVVALFLGVTLGHETVTAWEWCASAVVMMGVVILFTGRPAQGST